jgi:hypothetical protein
VDGGRAARERAASEREAFLCEACGGDETPRLVLVHDWFADLERLAPTRD